MTFIPTLQINNNKAIVYNYYAEEREPTDALLKTRDNLNIRDTNGFMSRATKSKVSKMLHAWICALQEWNPNNITNKYLRNKHITFCTLTLCAKQKHDDNYIKRHMLGYFLTQIQRKHQNPLYFWRAEPQKNGNIHFHLLLGKYINHEEIRSIWNNILDQHGYLQDFYLKHKHRNPNSTDIQGLDKISNVSAYVIKYCCKVSGYRKIEGRIWGASENLKNITVWSCRVHISAQEFLEMLKNNSKTQIYKDENFTIFKNPQMLSILKNRPELYNDYNSYYRTLYDYLYNDISVPCSAFDPLADERIELSRLLEAHQQAVNDSIYDIHDYYKKKALQKKEVKKIQYELF